MDSFGRIWSKRQEVKMLNTASWDPLQVTHYVAEYLDLVESLPFDLQRNVSLMREIDSKYQGNLLSLSLCFFVLHNPLSELWTDCCWGFFCDVRRRKSCCASELLSEHNRVHTVFTAAPLETSTTDRLGFDFSCTFGCVEVKNTAIRTDPGFTLPSVISIFIHVLAYDFGGNGDLLHLPCPLCFLCPFWLDTIVEFGVRFRDVVTDL